MRERARLVPELMVSDIGNSLAFYTKVLGFSVLYQRPDERFAYLTRDGAEIMIEQTAIGGRRFAVVEPTYPFGRGMNLQIEVEDVAALHEAVLAGQYPVFLSLEDRWYRTGATEEGNRQFIALDPDGYLLRFFQSLGSRDPDNRADA